MRGAVPPLSQYYFIAWFLIKQWIRLHVVVLSYVQGNCTFTFYLLSMNILHFTFNFDGILKY